jgi:hypothetical protein
VDTDEPAAAATRSTALKSRGGVRSLSTVVEGRNRTDIASLLVYARFPLVRLPCAKLTVTIDTPGITTRFRLQPMS